MLTRRDDFARNLVCRSLSRDGQIIGVLQVKPQLRGGSEIECQAQGGIRGDAALAVHDQAHPAHGDTDVAGELIHA